MAFEIFQKFLIEKGLKPNDITYGCLLSACVNANQKEKALQVYDMIKNDGIFMNTILYTTLIKGYSRWRQFDRAEMIYKEMCNTQRAQPNIVTFNSLIDCSVRCEHIERARF